MTHDLEAVQAKSSLGSAPSCARPTIDVIVIHETNGRKYLEALDVLARQSDIDSVGFHGASVLWRLAHAHFRDRMPMRLVVGIARDNLRFLLRLGSVRNKIVVIAVAPWDFRLIWLASMLRGNRLVYNTSWPWWTGDRVPRRYGILTSLFRSKFKSILQDPNVTVVTVTDAAAKSLAQAVPGVQPHVISHVVSEAFFVRQARFRAPFRLLFVGELLEKKGLRDVIAIADALGSAVELDIVGDGPLRDLAAAESRRPGRRWHGKVTSRDALANIAADCQLLLSLPRRTATWEELFGMAIIEAMASGLPCVVTDHVGPHGIITHGENGFLTDEGDLASALECIQSLISQPARWQAVGSAARDRAREYSMAAVSARWHELLTDVAAEGRGTDRPLARNAPNPAADGPSSLRRRRTASAVAGSASIDCEHL